MKARFSTYMIRMAINLSDRMRRAGFVALLCAIFLFMGGVFVTSSTSAGVWVWKTMSRLTGYVGESSNRQASSAMPMEIQNSSNYVVTPIDISAGGTSAMEGSAAIGINAGGDITGIYSNAVGIFHGFVRTANGTITTFDAPSAGSSGTAQGTVPLGINASGQIVGTSIDSNRSPHGFVRTVEGTITEFNAPTASSGASRGTTAIGINDLGAIVGFYTTGSDATGSNYESTTYHGFLRAADGTITTIDAPDAGAGVSINGEKLGTSAFAINASGMTAGTYTDATEHGHAFVRAANGTFTEFDAPGAVTTRPQNGMGFWGTIAVSIDSAGDAAGYYTDANAVHHGFLRAANGSFTIIDPPNSAPSSSTVANGTIVTSIDPGGQYITGGYSDAAGAIHGFLRAADGTFTVFDAPNAAVSMPYFPGTGGIGVNGSGNVAGFYADQYDVMHGILMAPVVAATATPVFSPSAGTYTSVQSVTITDTTPGATIYYTTDGTTPTTSSSVYSGPITVAATQTIKAIATASGYSQSAVGSATYTITLPRASAPRFSPGSGIYTSTQTVTLSDSTPGATIYYTTDGATPTTSSTVYSGPIIVAATQTIKAMATASGYKQSGVASSTYIIAAATPTFSPGAGAYTSTQTVIISDATAGATIYYTTDGSVPTVSSSVYTGPITVASTGTLEAIATASGYDTSEVGSAGYLITPSAVGGAFEWTWMGGTSAGDQAGVYGTLGVPAATNVPGGRDCAASWTDSSGHFWLFGGAGYDSSGALGSLNDLWEFNPSTNQWTWLGGSSTVGSNGGQSGVYGTLRTPATGNVPGGRSGAISWTDSSGHLWLFGGVGYDSSGAFGYLNDLWEFNPSTNQWTWMGGSSTVGSNYGGQSGVYGVLGTPAAGNAPGGRESATSWTDINGHLWLFGGDGYDSSGAFGLLNDLWEFNPSTKQWTWMSGSSTVGSNGGQSGVYGVLGTPAPGNIPGGRESATSWTDSSGHLWLFGGFGTDVNGDYGELNDLWEFDPSTNQWTWTSGSSTVGSNFSQSGVYGVLGTPAPGNIPGGRESATSWTDSSGHLWLFGGLGADANGAQGELNDLWEFDPSTNQWTWTSGSITVGGSKPGIYGVLGTPAPGNRPGGRDCANSWTDRNGDLWLFGGWGYNAASQQFATFNDLWKYRLSGSSQSVATPAFSPVAGTYTAAQTVTISDATAGAAIYYTLDGSTPTIGSAIYSGPITVSSTRTIKAIAIAGYSQSEVASATYTINLPMAATPAFSPLAGTYPTSQTVTISDTTPDATIYYTTDGTTPTLSSSLYTGPITVSSSETLEAIATASGYSTSAVAVASYFITPLAIDGAFNWTWMGGSNTVGGSGGQSGVYGVLGTPAAENVPGGRELASTWTDSSGNVWVFGGRGYDANGNRGYLNDLWKLNPLTNQWTWVGGSSTIASMVSGQCKSNQTCGNPGVYGSLGSSAAENIPGGREEAATWIDSGGRLWLFGGFGFDVNGNSGRLNDLWTFNQLTNEWTWMGGSSMGGTTNPTGVYGTLGTPASGNIPRGRSGAASWTDSSGNLWLFGGFGTNPNLQTRNGTSSNSAVLNDVWKFNPSTLQWTWMGGSSTFGDNLGMWGIFGASGVYGTLGTPAAGNLPGGRWLPACWTDRSGNFWLLGGYGFDSSGNGGFLNDIWEFNPTTNQWAWMGGSSTVPSNNGAGGNSGVYGALGTPAAGNIPGGRWTASSVTDSSGNFWLLGGWAYDANGVLGYLNDLWEFNSSTLKWTWMGGSSTVPGNNGTGGQPGIYGTLGTPAAGNIPGSRSQTAFWTDKSGNLWLFGGYGFDASGASGDLNDLWKYQPSAPALPAAATPTFSPSAGTYTSAQSVTISDTTPGATIYYTTDGTTPNVTPSELYSSPITVSSTETIQAFAVAAGYSQSALATAVYSINILSTPPITWATPAPITYGTALDANQLNASSPVAGTFAYSPPLGTELGAGSHTLTATFTPADTANYTTATASVTLIVNRATPAITWPTPAAITYGTPLSATQLNATTTPEGNFAYTPSAGTVLGAGTHTLSATFTPTDAADYATATATVQLTVNKATPAVVVTPNPASITTAQSTSVTVTVNGSAGTATPTGTIVLTSGSYASASTTLGSGSATITVPSGSLAAGSNTVTATYTPDTISSSTYNVAVGTASVAVSVPVPTLTGISPGFVTAGSSAFAITLTGSNFISASTIRLGATALATTFGSSTSLSASVPASLVANPGQYTVQVISGSGSATAASNSLLFEVDSASSANGPTFTTITATVTAGSSATYPVTLPASATNISVSCLNLPIGAGCSYSASTGTVTITTSATTPTGTYQITVVFTETLPGASGLILIPLLLLPLAGARRRWKKVGIMFVVFVGLAIAATAGLSGCGGSSGGGGSTPLTHTVTSSGSVSLTVH